MYETLNLLCLLSGNSSFGTNSAPASPQDKESFIKPYVTGNVVIPVKTGILCYQMLSGFLVKPGMTGDLSKMSFR